ERVQLPRQSPVATRPSESQGFPIGRLDPPERQQIEVREPLPLLLPPTIFNLDENAADDTLAGLVRAELRARQFAGTRGGPAEAPGAWYIEVLEQDGALKPSASYSVANG